MVVQAGALRETLTADDPGRSILDSMADTGRQALAEMRRVLDLLRVTDGGERTPQPSVEQIGTLVAQMRAAGLRVELTVDGTPRPVPIAVGVSAYRIVQEALTNVLKHAGAAHGPRCWCATCLTRSSCGSATTAPRPRPHPPPAAMA